MRPSGHRAIRTLAVFLVLALGVAALLPLTARGATGQVNGLVSTCTTITPFVAGAVVTLIDANGISPNLIAVTNGAGVYTFVGPPSGSYTVSVTRSGYYSNATTTPKRFDGSSTTTISLCLVQQPIASKTLTVHVRAGGSPVGGATVAAVNISNPTGKPQQVATNTTNSTTGDANLSLWGAPFQIRTSAAGYQTDQTNVDVSTTSSVTINLVGGNEVFGHVRDPDGNFLGSGVVAWLYDPTAPTTSAYRLIAGTVSSSLFDFHAPAGTYKIIVDADQHLAYENTIVLPGGVTNPYDVKLQPAPREVYQTTVAYSPRDWNNLTVWRNLTLNPDSTLTGLTPANLRDMRLQVDSTVGDGNGVLSAGEITLFHDWLVQKGPAYVTTDGFFTTNGRAYVNVSSYTVTVEKLDVPGSRVWINTTATYNVKQAPPWIVAGAKNYFVNVTTIPDTNVSVYQDYVYLVVLPKSYELNTSTIVPSNAPVMIANFTRVTIDPGVTTGSPQVRMKISQSVNGTARAKVDSPVGKFYVKNASFTNYQALVAGNTTLVYSANDSTDPNGHITNANFTWHFTPTDVRYGIDPAFNFTRSGNFTVNLKVVEVGGNVTFRNITVLVDDQHPVARITTNRTGSGNANNTTLRVNEGVLVRFDARLSTDLAFVNQTGVILNSGYSWDFNGDHIADAVGRIVNHTFQKPGNFTVNLTVTDSVGWKSVNATMHAIVNDTKGPVAAFDILDPSNEWTIITSPIEQKQIALNASKTTDDYDKLSALNFTWTIPGPVVGSTGLNHTFWGPNISFAWREWNNSYKVVLSVHDTGFPTGKVNYGNISRNITVQIDPLLHADLRVEVTTLKVSPADPEEGATITVTINVTNKAGRKWATSVVTNLSAISGGQTTLVTKTAQWLDKNGNPFRANLSIAPGETAKIVFTGQLFGQGNKTLQVYIYDTSEPYTWLVDNKASTTLNVRQPAWQPYAIAGAVIGIIVLFVFGMYARRKIKAGEWRPVRGRRRERGGGEEEEKRPRREEKEEKKRL